LVESDGALVVGLGVLDVQAAVGPGWFADGLVDADGATRYAEVWQAQREAFAKACAGIGKAGEQRMQVRVVVADSRCQGAADLFWAGRAVGSGKTLDQPVPAQPAQS
jgi:hypothetical protein